MSASHAIKEDLIQEQILQAAHQLFKQHGLSKVTMDDVAKAIGKGRSSLYYYYKSKDEIFEAVMDSEIRKMFTEVSRAVDKVSTVEQKIRAFCMTKLKILAKKRGAYNAMDVGMDANEMSNFTKTKHAHHRRIMKQEGALIRQILIDGVEKGELSALSQKDQDVLIFVLLSSVRGIKQEMVIENDFSGIEPVVAALTHLIFHGLGK
jgi:AcrR family transcriptional regulator